MLQAYYQRGLARMKLKQSKGIQDFNRALAINHNIFQVTTVNNVIIVTMIIIIMIAFFFFFFFCVPQLYLWGSPFLGEIFAYVTIF